MKSDSFDISPARWTSAVLVCKDCRKRSSGPKKLKGKDVVHEARRAVRDIDPRPRVFMTGCLGLCPKMAQAVAIVGGAGQARLAALTSLDQVGVLLATSG